MIRCVKIFCACFFTAAILYACSTPEKLSRKYYLSRRTELQQINSFYTDLWKIQPFILNFTDARFKHYSLEVSTDTVRYVYNTSIMKFSVADSISRFGLDSIMIKKLGQMMVGSKCICVAHHSFYSHDREFAANWLFFKQVQTSMFKESRYHVLIFFKELLPADIQKEFIERQNLVQLEDNVFYTVSNRFK